MRLSDTELPLELLAGLTGLGRTEHASRRALRCCIRLWVTGTRYCTCVHAKSETYSTFSLALTPLGLALASHYKGGIYYTMIVP